MDLLDLARAALAAEPAPRRATPQEAAELRELIAEILANDTDADQAEALEVASRDPDAALICFRALRDEQRENGRWGVRIGGVTP